MAAASFLWPNDAAPVAGQPGFLHVGRQMDRQLRRQQYSEIADRQQRQRREAEPARQLRCDFGSSSSVEATAMTQAVSAKRRIEVPGSSDSTTVMKTQTPNRMKPGDSNEASPRRLSRIASATVSNARHPNAA